MAKNGMIHLYYGDGKGKTTAALGMTLRALGYGKKVVLVQFLKNTPCGELNALMGFSGVTVLRGQAGAHFTFAMTELERQQTKAIHEDNLSQAQDMIARGCCDLLILDEVTDALKTRLVEETDVRKVIFEKPQALELVLTGHDAPEWIIDAADYVTEVKKHKHPYDRGILAREGIEY